MDKIIIKNLKARCIIGIHHHERQSTQDVQIDLTLLLDLSKAALSDDVKDTVDYDNLAKKIIAYVETSQFKLLEKLAYKVAKLTKDMSQAKEVKVVLRKPAAISKAEYAAVEVNI